jgi:hypothetical protein
MTILSKMAKSLPKKDCLKTFNPVYDAYWTCMAELETATTMTYDQAKKVSAH